MTDLTDDFWRLTEEHKRLKEELERLKQRYEWEKEELERLKRQYEWDHDVLKHIDIHRLDYSYDYFLYLRTHAGWCPKCETIDDAEGGEFYEGRELQSPNDNGQYECGICYHNEVEA